MPDLSIRSVTKVYPTLRRALDRFSLDIGPGVLGLLGPNGAGKSTLLRILAAELDFEQGEAILDNRWNVRTDMLEWRRRLAYMPQSFDFVPHMTGREYLCQTALLAGYSSRSLAHRISALLDMVRLGEAADRMAHNYSRGMKQRLAIAATFLAEPQLVLLDEPTSGLDPKERIFFRDLLAGMARNQIVILSTHIVGDVERCCDRVAVIGDGRLLFDGSPASLSQTAAGSVWEMPVVESDAMHSANGWQLVGLRERDGGTVARVLAPEAPTPDAVACEAGLEDGYMRLMGAAGVDAGRQDVVR